MYTKINVVKPAGISPGSAAAKDPNVIIVDVEDILVFPPRDSKGIVHVGNFVFKPNANMLQVYMTKSKISAPYESDGDEDSISIKQSFEGQHPGNKREIRELIQNWLGRNVIVIHGSCSETERQVVGTPCAPLQLKPSGQDNNDGRFHMLKFEAFAKSAFLPGIYEGALVLGAPAVVADVSPMTVNSGLSGLQYQLPALAVTEAIEIIWGSLSHGDIITLIGGGGVAPATLSDGPGVAALTATIVLKDGTTWTALEGSTISLRAYSSADSYFIEESRT